MSSGDERACRTDGICPLALVLLVLHLSFAIAPGIAGAQTPTTDTAFAVVLDPVTLQRHGSLTEGQPIEIHVVALGFDGLFGDGLRGAQFRVEVDPRLTVLLRQPAPAVGLQFQPAPDEWVMTLDQCASESDFPLLLMTYEVLLPPGAPSTDDLRIGVGDLVDYGEPMLYSHCFDSSFLDPVSDFGDVLLNPSSPSIVHFGGTRSPVVEGRSYDLVWETASASAVTLDGAPVDLDGLETRAATTTVQHRLVASSGAFPTTRTFDVEVIREPRVDSFTARLTPSGSVALAWSVEGATEVSVDGLGRVNPLAGRLVPLVDPPVWVLRAQNEWGDVTVPVALDGFDQLPPVILHYSASSNPYVPGSPVTLSWEIVNAGSASIDPDVGPVDPASGSVQVLPVGEVDYTLSTTNANGTTSSTLTLAPGPPAIRLFEIDPVPTFVNSTVEVSWQVDGADHVEITPEIGVVGPEGTAPLFITGPTTVRILASNAYGSVSGQVYVGIIDAQIEQFVADPPLIHPGTSTLLNYSARPASLELSIEPDVGPVPSPSGSVLVTPPADGTVYTLFAAAAGSTLTRSVTVGWRVPDLRLTVSDSTPPLGATVTLTAMVFGADSATLEPGFGSIDPTGGTFEVTPQEQTTYVLSATNAKGTAQTQVTVSPVIATPEATLTASTTTPFAGFPFNLHVSLQNAASATLQPGFGIIPPTNATYTTSVDATTTFVLTATNDFGTVESSLVITPRLPVAILTPSARSVLPGEVVELSVQVQGAEIVTLEPGFGQIVGSGTYSTAVEQTTTFVLTATNPLGSTVREETVEVLAPLVMEFRADPPAILVGESSTLRWTVDGADSVRVEGVPQMLAKAPEQGSRVVSPTVPTRYTLNAYNSAGVSTAQTTLDVAPFVIRSFTAVPSLIRSGEPSQLSWVVDGVADVELVGFGLVPQVGSMEVSPATTTTFVLRATNGEEMRQTEVVVSVVPAGSGTLALGWSETEYPGPRPIIQPFVVFDVYAVALAPTDGILGYEFSLDVPPEYLVLNPFYYGEDPIDVGFGVNEFIVGTGVCLPEAPVVPLLRLPLLLVADPPPSGALAWLSGTTPTSFPDTGGPGFYSCARELVPFLVVNPLDVSADSGVPTVIVHLEGGRENDGVHLRWSGSGGGAPELVELLRRQGSGAEIGVLRLEGEAARTTSRWVDRELPSGTDPLFYRLEAEFGGVRVQSREVRVEAAPPAAPERARTRLLPNVPNPFNPSTELRWTLGAAGDVRLDLYDVAGRRVRRLHLLGRPAGEGAVVWDGRDDDGLPVASGVYMLRLSTRDGTDTRRITLLR